MNAQQLRNSILQEALQGHLVPQDANDEPASVLLQRIHTEKERLVKEGKLKKKDIESKPIEEEEIPFEIPESWVWKRWGDLAESIQYGYNAPAKQKGRIKMVRISDIQNGRIVWETVPFCDITEVEIETYLLKKNDILFARTGGTVGKSYLVKDTPEEAIYAGYLIRTRYSDQLCPRYLKLFMESSLYWSQLKEGTIATAQPNCNGKTLSKMMLPIPPLAEQQRIAAKVEELMTLVETYGQIQIQHDKLQAELPAKLRQSILQEAIQGRLVPQDPSEEPATELLKHICNAKEQLVKEGKLKKKDLISKPIEDDEIPYEIPVGWEWVRLNQCCIRIFSGKSPVYSKTPTKHKIIGQQANQWNRIEMQYVKYGTEEYAKTIDEYQYLEDGDVLLNTLGNGTLGRCGIFENISEKVLTDGHLFVFRTVEKAVSKYILYYLTLNYIEINKNADGSTNQTFLNLKNVSNYLIPLPPLKEIRRIVEKKEEVYNRIKA